MCACACVRACVCQGVCVCVVMHLEQHYVAIPYKIFRMRFSKCLPSVHHSLAHELIDMIMVCGCLHTEIQEKVYSNLDNAF